MAIRTHIISAAEHVFDENGFMATGMDRLTQAAGVSTRTLYKHAGSKIGLICAVLAARDRRFRDRLDVDTVEALFEVLEVWMREESPRGCLFLRAAGETGGQDAQINAAIEAQKKFLRQRILDIITIQTGRKEQDALADQVLVLFEGATAAATYRGPAAITAARRAAAMLLAEARGER